ncbi:MAG: DUF5009 domain-containing protein [Pedobacter sp.]|nr:MAG: DUF5009 domain-containing protein [Pedobacter sp.]
MELARNQSLDVLRGTAILLMVLCSSIAFGNVLPSWMFHAQTPPPYHVFNPDLPGITWVDLVFPLFLFSMGAAIPLAMEKKHSQGSVFKPILHLVSRFALLAFFAIFTLNARSWVMDKGPDSTSYFTSIVAFILLFFMYGNLSRYVGKLTALVIKFVSFGIGIAFLALYPFAYGSFDPEKSDVIILVLANMAFFGGLIWYFTAQKPLLRLAILPFIMAIFLGSEEVGSINNLIFNWSPIPWMYKFYYLKYLFIIIPGTIAGDWILTDRKRRHFDLAFRKRTAIVIAILSIALIVINLWGLFSRELILNLFLNVIGCLALLFLTKKLRMNELFSKLAQSGVYLLMLGLFFEAYEGGIKKDYSTYSYYFVCSGLAFFALLSFTIVEKLTILKQPMNFIAANGKNPMIAYTAGNLLLIPLLKMTSLSTVLDSMNSNALMGFTRGIIFTGIVAMVTVFFTRIQFFWKT